MLYIISGKVIKGDGYGRKIGFPTVNLEVDEALRQAQGKQFPRDGVYAGTATMEGKIYRAGIVIGPNNRIEAHMIGYVGDAYGKEVTLEINKFLREFKKFDTEEELIEQIKKDLNLV
ncbi:riboflavin kinase [Candidatus Nomurabacteria bacterium]|nr:riboflavin kinase [Candidatus Nomurabacteria bacterium]